MKQIIKNIIFIIFFWILSMIIAMMIIMPMDIHSPIADKLIRDIAIGMMFCFIAYYYNYKKVSFTAGILVILFSLFTYFNHTDDNTLSPQPQLEASIIDINKNLPKDINEYMRMEKIKISKKTLLLTYTMKTIKKENIDLTSLKNKLNNKDKLCENEFYRKLINNDFKIITQLKDKHNQILMSFQVDKNICVSNTLDDIFVQTNKKKQVDEKIKHTVNIIKTQKNLPLPKGYCKLSTSNSNDLKLINYMKEANKDKNFINFLFADCEQLEQWRKGKLKTLNDYGHSATPTNTGYKRLNISNQEFIEEVEKSLKTYKLKKVDDSVNKIEKIAKKYFDNMDFKQTKYLGVLGKDEYAVYFGFLLKIKTEDNKLKNIIGIFATTLYDKVPLNLYLYKEYKGKRTIYDLQDIMTLWMQRIHS